MACWRPRLLRLPPVTDLYAETTNLRLVQKALGHADVSTTQIYTHLVDGQLEAAMRGGPEPPLRPSLGPNLLPFSDPPIGSERGSTFPTFASRAIDLRTHDSLRQKAPFRIPGTSMEPHL